MMQEITLDDIEELASMLCLPSRLWPSPISSLPVGLLSRILALVLADFDHSPDTFNLHRVCRLWRTVLLDADPSQWTTLVYKTHKKSRLSYVNLFLEKSRGAPLAAKIHLYLPHERLGDRYKVPKMILGQLERIESLVVEAFFEGYWPNLHGQDEDFSAMNNLCFNLQAPLLRYLEFTRSSERTGDIRASDASRLFRGADLYHLKLQRVGVHADSHLLGPRLTYLHLQDLPCFDQFGFSDIRNVLARMPGLEHLHLQNALDAAKTVIPPLLSAAGPLHLPHLKTLVVKEECEMLHGFFTLFSYPGTLEKLEACSAFYGSKLERTLVETVRDSCTDWERFWTHDIRGMDVIIEQKNPSEDSLSYNTMSICGTSGDNFKKFTVEIPYGRTSLSRGCAVSVLLASSGNHQITSMSWAIPPYFMPYYSRFTPFSRYFPLEKVGVRSCMLELLAARLMDDPAVAATEHLAEIVVEGPHKTRMETLEAEDPGLIALLEALQMRYRIGFELPKVTFLGCRPPPEFEERFKKLVDTVVVDRKNKGYSRPECACPQDTHLHMDTYLPK